MPVAFLLKQAVAGVEMVNLHILSLMRTFGLVLKWIQLGIVLPKTQHLKHNYAAIL